MKSIDLGQSLCPEEEPYHISILLEQLVGDLSRNNRHTIEKAALFHLNFERIHLFIDGNGEQADFC